MNFNKSVTNGGHHPISPSQAYPHSYLEASMARSFYPKYASYTGDGSGRDSYVILNNGGLANVDKRCMNFGRPAVPRDNHPVSQKHAVAFKYVSDGSGRDSYVM